MNIFKYDLWMDEVVSDTFSDRFVSNYSQMFGVSPVSVLIDKIKADPPSSLYYLTINFYSKLFGDGKSLRIVSLLFSMLTLYLIYLVSRLFFSQRASIYAVLIMAINPFHIWYAQEARVYSMACFFSLLMVYFFIKGIRSDKKSFWLGFVFAGILAVYSSYHAGFLLVATLIALFFKKNRKHSVKLVFSIIIIVLFSIVLNPALKTQIGFVKSSFWLQPPKMIMLVYTLMVFTLGYSASLVQHIIGMLVYVVLFVYGINVFLKVDKEDTILLFSFFIFPIIAVFAFSKTILPVYLNRQMIMFSPFYYLLVAKGIDSIKKRDLRLISLVIVILLGLFSLRNFYKGKVYPEDIKAYCWGNVHEKKNYSELVEYVVEQYKEGDMVAATDLESYNLFLLYVVKNYKELDFHPSGMFRYVFYPKYVEPFTSRFLQIDEHINELSLDVVEDLHDCSLTNTGSLSVRKFNSNKTPFKRIWLLSSSTIKASSISNSSVLVRNKIAESFYGLSSKEKDGFYVDLFVKK
ncbi:MAG: glycosyltransferase family 39 protein [Candidatus Omnitrophica bacterium]|nr:glycosyltransferase family 39 protein [Candidatus Omnitrophota bacterium]MBU1997184.1 glycosyltransferase family 39 protein [Candidatus Omnitrophota bacterium]MBU4333790.1 glycosyltransferase family 39 protein [Candidatus Omnitrophota bacterium]